MDILLNLVDPETHQTIASWQSPTLVSVLRMHGIDLAAYLPTEALSRTWGTTRLEETLERHLEGLGETTTRLEKHSKRESDLTSEERAEMENAQERRQFTRDGYTMVEWESHVPQQDSTGTLDRDKGEIQGLLDFLRQGREEGALLDNSMYPVGEAQAAGEPSLPTTTSFLSSPSHRDLAVADAPTELSPAILQQNPGLGTPGNSITEEKREEEDDPSVTAYSEPYSPLNGPIEDQEEEDDEESAVQQETHASPED